jgi:hypothetical protein
MAWQPALAVTSEVDSNTTLGTRNSNGDMHKNDSDKENASTNSPKLSLRKRFVPPCLAFLMRLYYVYFFISHIHSIYVIVN